MSISKKQKEEIVRLYSDMPPLPEKYYSWCIKQSAKDIYVDHNGNGWCSKCESKVMLSKTKHRQDYKCPNCNRWMKINHVWRQKHCQYEETTVDWYVFPELVDENILALRYVVVYKIDTEPYCEERARLIIDCVKKKEHTLETRSDNVWQYRTWDYFREHNMGYGIRRWCCLYAKLYPYSVPTINKLKVFEHFKAQLSYFDKYTVDGALYYLVNRADLYEKLQFVQMDKLIHEDFNTYSYYKMEYKKGESSLIKMLGLNKNSFNLLRSNQNLKTVKYLQKNPDITEKQFEKAKFLGFSGKLDELTKKYNIKYGKTFSYIKKNVLKSKNINGYDFAIDYCDYVQTLDKLGYPLDNQYLYPKDFRKEDKRVHEELTKKIQRRNNMTRLDIIKEEARIDQTINKIANALRENKELRQWMKGSTGLKVIVPESVGELTDEGIKLHNCLSGYANKIADKQSLIFFIRKLDDPEKSFIAMEYCNGYIAQIRLNNNAPVEDTNILSFAEAFARKLTQLNVINELRRSA